MFVCDSYIFICSRADLYGEIDIAVASVVKCIACTVLHTFSSFFFFSFLSFFFLFFLSFFLFFSLSFFLLFLFLPLLLTSVFPVSWSSWSDRLATYLNLLPYVKESIVLAIHFKRTNCSLQDLAELKQLLSREAMLEARDGFSFYIKTVKTNLFVVSVSTMIKKIVTTWTKRNQVLYAYFKPDYNVHPCQGVQFARFKSAFRGYLMGRFHCITT